MLKRKKNDTKVTIAIDAMGGDDAPAAMLRGAAKATELFSGLEFLIYGDEAEIDKTLGDLPNLKAKARIIHTNDVVGDDEKPSVALRRSKNTSMGMAIKAVRLGEAAGIVSSGNTGALMAISKIVLRTLPGIERPAIGGTMPSIKGDNIMLDLGANVHCDANNLYEFAVMGDAFARVLLQRENPSIGLLNVGSEDIKGPEALQSAASMLQDDSSILNFHGFVEGNDIGKGTVDVIVTDGFTGNIALKTVEGTASMCLSFLQKFLRNGILARIGAVCAMKSFKKLKSQIDPRFYNGAMFLGLNGVVVKSHGGSDYIGHCNAIERAAQLAIYDINAKIVEEMINTGHILPIDENGDGDELLDAETLIEEEL